MPNILPAIISPDAKDLMDKVHKFEGEAEWVHLDAMDGTLTSSTSWHCPDDLSTIAGKLKLEVHLMIEWPEAVIGNWAKVVDRVLFHVESTDQLADIVESFSSNVVELGLVLNFNTSLNKLDVFTEAVKVIQLMSIAEIGEQGHPFEERVLEKIRLLRERNSDVKIQVDGGVSLDNARQLFEAGADNLVVGSAIWKTPDPLMALKQFQNLTNLIQPNEPTT